MGASASDVHVFMFTTSTLMGALFDSGDSWDSFMGGETKWWKQN